MTRSILDWTTVERKDFQSMTCFMAAALSGIRCCRLQVAENKKAPLKYCHRVLVLNNAILDNRSSSKSPHRKCIREYLLSSMSASQAWMATATPTRSVISIALYKIRLAPRKWKKQKGASLLLVESSSVERDWRYLYTMSTSQALCCCWQNTERKAIRGSIWRKEDVTRSDDVVRYRFAA